MLKESPTFSTIRTPSSYPASHKRYFRGDHADMRVPYREITLSATHHTDRGLIQVPFTGQKRQCAQRGGRTISQSLHVQYGLLVRPVKGTRARAARAYTFTLDPVS